VSTTSTRAIVFAYSGDINDPQQTWADSVNPASPGPGTLINLILGANTIAVPSGGTTIAATILKPPLGAVTLTLKGASGDTGILLGQGPDSISLATGQTSFVIVASAALAGVRIAWH
jgi:hypothetical protein